MSALQLHPPLKRLLSSLGYTTVGKPRKLSPIQQNWLSRPGKTNTHIDPRYLESAAFFTADCYSLSPRYPWLLQYNTYMLIVNDLTAPNAVPSLEGQGPPRIPDPALRYGYPAGRLLNFVKHAAMYYEPYTYNLLNSSTTAFATSRAVEIRFPRGFKLDQRTSRFPRFFRRQTSNSIGYAAALFPRALFAPKDELGGQSRAAAKEAEPLYSSSELHRYIAVIPELAAFMDLCNDLLSLYKEAKQQDEFNYVAMRWAVSGKPTLEIFEEMAEEFLEVRKGLLEFEGDELVRDVVRRFVEGFVRFHVQEPRYELHEVLDLDDGGGEGGDWED